MGDLLGLEVDAVEPLQGQRDLLQRVLAAAFGTEFGAGAVVEGPGRDAGEVEELALVVGLHRVEKADDVRLPRDLLVDLPVEGGLPGLVAGLDTAAGQDPVLGDAGPGAADDQHRVIGGDEDGADSFVAQFPGKGAGQAKESAFAVLYATRFVRPARALTLPMFTIAPSDTRPCRA
ncbi:hypothetical protein J3A78_006720 [Streptomyces sp. PvR006]|nr:hypothetical protein [Streptomyces sp. PvR006]